MTKLSEPQLEAARRDRLAKSWERQELASAFEAMGAKRKTLDVPCPLFLAEGEGAYVKDVDGNRYLDMIMGFGPHILGHRPPVVEDALKRQIEQGWHFGLTNELQSVLAEKLVDAYGGHGKVLFSGSGSDAVMYALRLARAATGRDRIAVFDGSYHGNIDYVLMGVDAGSPVSAPTSSVIGAGVPTGVIDRTMLMLPYRHDAAYEQIEKQASDIAGVLVQTVQNSLPRLDNGLFLRHLRELCDAQGILLIFDEVVTGFRLAYGGGREFFGIEPDISAFGKTLGGGLPVGAIWGCNEVMSLLPRDNNDGGVFSSGTFNANPLTMATGTAMIQYLEAHRSTIYARLQNMGERLTHEVNTYANSRQMRATLMQAGSILCLHFERGELNSSRDIKNHSVEAKSAFFLAMMDRGILMPASRMTLLSDAHEDSDIDKLVAAITETLDLLQDRRLI